MCGDLSVEKEEKITEKPASKFIVYISLAAIGVMLES